MSDSKLIQDILAGNNNAFRELIEKYQDRVFRTAMGFVHSKEDAEDITQEVFINVFQSLHKFKGDSEFSTWIYRITVNNSLNFINRNKKNWFLQSIDEIFNKSDDNNTPLEDLEMKERDERIKKAIDSLPESQRTAFVLSKYEELSQREIAQIMKRTEGAIEQLLQRAKNNLQKKLEQDRRK